MTQVAPWAPWEIKRADLDGEPVRGIIEHLHKTGKLVLKGIVRGNSQRCFRKTNNGAIFNLAPAAASAV
jgi:hypothetical protein